jgi:DNA-binding transcriptional ArsR family regulator
LESLDGKELLILSRLRQLGPASTNKMVHSLHLNRESVSKKLEKLSEGGLITVSSPLKSQGKFPEKDYSAVAERDLPKMDPHPRAMFEYSFDPDFINAWATIELSRLLGRKPPDKKHRRLPRILPQKGTYHGSDPISKLGKKDFAKRKKTLEALYDEGLYQFKLILHLFLSELLTLDVLYQERTIDSYNFSTSFEKLSQTYFGAYLSGELSELLKEKFITLQYGDSNSTELGITLQKQFRSRRARLSTLRSNKEKA